MSWPTVASMLSPYAADRAAVIAEFGDIQSFDSGEFARRVAKLLVKELKYHLPVRNSAGPVEERNEAAPVLAEGELIVGEISDDIAPPASSEEADLAELETVAFNGIRYLILIAEMIKRQIGDVANEVQHLPTTAIKNRRRSDLLDGDDYVLEFWRSLKENAAGDLRTSYGVSERAMSTIRKFFCRFAPVIRAVLSIQASSASAEGMFSIADWISTNRCVSLKELNERVLLRQFFLQRYGHKEWNHELWSAEARRIAEFSFRLPFQIPAGDDEGDIDEDVDGL